MTAKKFEMLFAHIKRHSEGRYDYVSRMAPAANSTSATVQNLHKLAKLISVL